MADTDTLDLDAIFGKGAETTAYEDAIDINSILESNIKDKYAVLPIDVFSEASKYITGVNIMVDGGQTAW